METTTLIFFSIACECVFRFCEYSVHDRHAVKMNKIHYKYYEAYPLSYTAPGISLGFLGLGSFSSELLELVVRV